MHLRAQPHNARRDTYVAQSTDRQADRKASAAAADDETVFRVTPFGRRRRRGRLRAATYWILHLLGFPFFYVYNQLRDRRRTAPQKWSDASGHHGTAPASPAAEPARTGK
jgi:hypothetical protein